MTELVKQDDLKFPYVFLKSGGEFQVLHKNQLDVYPQLPPGNYVVKVTLEGQFYLAKIDDFVAPPKLYGKTKQHAERILYTFHDRPTSTGVLLDGEKGSGKTLLARTACMMAAEKGIPTIVINQNFSGDNFYSFLSKIHQPCIVLFDEFEKVYDTKKNEQDTILTLLDGVYPSKKLFFLTCNDKFGINFNMLNRPGRVFYAMEFTGLDKDFIAEYIADNLNNKEKTAQVVRITTMFSEFNFDMLKALVEEMNRYDETAQEALEMLNVSPANDYMYYKVSVLLNDGREHAIQHMRPDTIKSPLGMKNGMVFAVYVNRTAAEKKAAEKAGDDGDYDNRKIIFYPPDIMSSDDSGFVFKNKAGDILKLIREKATTFDWASAANFPATPGTITPADVTDATNRAAEEETEDNEYFPND